MKLHGKIHLSMTTQDTSVSAKKQVKIIFINKVHNLTNLECVLEILVKKVEKFCVYVMILYK